MIINQYLLITLGLFFALPLALTLGLMPPYIMWLKKKAYGQTVREDGPQHHTKKTGTPTAGGLIILLATWVSAIVGFKTINAYFNLPFNSTWETWNTGIVMLALTLLGVLGFTDDAMKIQKKHNKGVSGYVKLWAQALVGAAIGGYVLGTQPEGPINFFDWQTWPLYWGYVPFAIFAVISISNAVNLTDGLDGLAANTVSITLLAMAVIFGWPVSGLHNPELYFLCLILLAATLGFGWYNRHPAKIFMGDVGSLALGGAIATLGLIGGLDFWLLPLCGLFALEALSVVLQVASFKLTGKRLFKMSPLHHHFELSGWSERKVVAIFSLCHFIVCAATAAAVILLRSPSTK
ncbi:MAG: phospho-N-acetylmuramoyl-pentapeptide-transferase [Vampirovibrionales bacterium]|nr:phospho-N-acetylmuramoyl-pentapeptide-transferase [Vampirovibrionales bacterium]